MGFLPDIERMFAQIFPLFACIPVRSVAASRACTRRPACAGAGRPAYAGFSLGQHSPGEDPADTSTDRERLGPTYAPGDLCLLATAPASHPVRVASASRARVLVDRRAPVLGDRHTPGFHLVNMRQVKIQRIRVRTGGDLSLRSPRGTCGRPRLRASASRYELHSPAARVLVDRHPPVPGDRHTPGFHLVSVRQVKIQRIRVRTGGDFEPTFAAGDLWSSSIACVCVPVRVALASRACARRPASAGAGRSAYAGFSLGQRTPGETPADPNANRGRLGPISSVRTCRCPRCVRQRGFRCGSPKVPAGRPLLQSNSHPMVLHVRTLPTSKTGRHGTVARETAQVCAVGGCT